MIVMVILQKRLLIGTIGFLLVSFSPHVFLDYVYRVNDVELLIPFSQYAFFALTLFGGALLLFASGNDDFKILATDLQLVICCLLFSAGVFLSDHIAQSLRLAFIISCISMCSIASYSFVRKLPTKNQCIFVCLLAVPFLLPVFFSMLAEACSLINSQCF